MFGRYNSAISSFIFAYLVLSLTNWQLSFLIGVLMLIRPILDSIVLHYNKRFRVAQLKRKSLIRRT